MKNHKKSVITLVFTVFLALWMGLQGPISVIAGEPGAIYVKELYIVTDSDVAKYRNDKSKYMVFDTALYENTYDKNVHTKTYLVAELTNKVEEAITDIKAMRMNGGYSFEEYKNYLNSVKASVESQAKKIVAAVKEYRLNYQKGTAEAKAAYEMLNCLLYDDDQNEIKENGKYMKLGDLLLLDSNKLPDDKLVKVLTTLLLEANSDISTTLRTALTIACIRNEKGSTFLEVVQDEEYVDSLDRFDFSVYENYANSIACGTIELKQAMQVYEEKRAEYEKAVKEKTEEKFFEDLAKADFCNSETLSEFMAAVNNNNGTVTNKYELFLKGQKMQTMLKDVKYFGYNVVQDGDAAKEISMFDFLMLKDNVTAAGKSDKAKLKAADVINEMKYFASAMTDGLRSISGMSILDLTAIALTDTSVYTDEIAKLKNDENEETRKLMEEGISVFYGVDRDIYKEGMVAMTGTAISASASGDLSWSEKQKEYTEKAKSAIITKTASMYAMIGSGALAVGTGAAYLGYSYYISRHFVEATSITIGKTGTTGIALPISFGKAVGGYSMKMNNIYKVGFDPQVVKGTVTFDNINKWGSYGEVFDVETKEQLAYLEVKEHSDCGVKRGAMSTSAGIAMGVTFAVSLLTFVASVVLYCLNRRADPVYNLPYQEIPAILCDYRNNGDASKYIYYYGVKNPDLKTTESLYASTDDGTGKTAGIKTLPQNRRGVMDIFNWELRGNRQWECLYTTRDLNAGRPVIADSITINDKEFIDESIGLNHFGAKTASGEGEYIGNIGYNLVGPFNTSIDSITAALKSDQSKYKKPALYIHYKIDLKAEYNKEKSFLASMFTTGSGWAMTALGLVVGTFAGALIATKSSKKRKDEKEA